MSDSRLTRFLFALSCAVLSVALAQAAEVTVDCSKRNSKSINATLAALDKSVPDTVNIAGACHEIVVIDRFRDLTLVGKPGASISDPTPPQTDADGNLFDDDIVLFIGPQSNVTLRSLTVGGGGSGVTCAQISTCTLEDVIVQDVTGDGVSFGRSSGSLFGNTIIRRSLGVGLGLGASSVGGGALVEGGPGPQIIDNRSHGVRMTDNSTLRGGPYIIANNDGDGVNAFASAVAIGGAAVTENGGNGIVLQSSTLRGGELAISGNAKTGVVVSQLSYFRSGGDTITGNASPDVNCASVTAATSGLWKIVDGDPPTLNVGIGSTNCVEPAS